MSTTPLPQSDPSFRSVLRTMVLLEELVHTFFLLFPARSMIPYRMSP